MRERSRPGPAESDADKNLVFAHRVEDHGNRIQLFRFSDCQRVEGSEQTGFALGEVFHVIGFAALVIDDEAIAVSEFVYSIRAAFYKHAAKRNRMNNPLPFGRMRAIGCWC